MIEIFGQPFDLDNPESAYFHGDCMEGMKVFPDKWFDLAVVDPPYGDGGASSVVPPDLTEAPCLTDISPLKVNHAWGGRFERYKTIPNGRNVGGKICQKNY